MRVLLAVLAMAVVLFPLTAGATIINIPGDYPTIQEGIDHGLDGDTVLVQPGTYYENLNFNGHNVVLASLFLTTGDTTYISTTIIDGDSAGSVITFSHVETAPAISTYTVAGSWSSVAISATMLCSTTPGPCTRNRLSGTTSLPRIQKTGLYLQHIPTRLIFK